MNPLYAGLMCTLLLSGTVAGLFGCMSAVRCHQPFVFAICLTIVSLDFAALAMLLSRLPESAALSPAPWTAAALLLTVLSLSSLLLLRRKSRRQLSPVSIKESCDHLPSALCFAWENGLPCLKNLKMDELSHLLTGEALLNANVFWKAIESQPIVTLENGQTWSFERVQMEMAGKSIYQITGTNITEEARLQREVEKDNLRLKGMNRRLRQYGQDVQEATREKEILRAKTRVHDQIGRALLQTRQFLSGAQGDAESVCAVWRQNVRLLLGKYANEPYIRVLGFDKKGQEYLSYIRKTVEVPLITKTADYKEMLLDDIHAANIYNMIVAGKYGVKELGDYVRGPVRV